jgi:NAD(P)-dependent dehydrogenase (short-subunit alcohol dehydrogenase family)
MAIPRQETEDGFEMQLGVNHFGHFALTGRLFSLLTAGDGVSRVVTQSSGMHERGEMDVTDLNWEQSYSKWAAYGRSKLANLLFAYELQRRLDATGEDGVTSHACHPGYADTGLQGRSASESSNPLAGPLMKAANLVLAQSAEQGAYPMCYAATADLDGGEYVGPGGFLGMRGQPDIQESSAASYDEADARQLWERSVERTGVEYPLDAPA